MVSQQQLIDIPAQTPRMGNRFTAWIGRQGLSLLGWRTEGEFPAHRKMVLAVAPHTSNWDFFIAVFAMLALRLKLNFLGKHSIFVWPIKGFLLAIGGIPVFRDKAHGLVDQMVAQFAQRESLLLALAPEGTRSKVVNWKSGFLHIAHRANVPVLLVGLDYKRKALVFGPLLEVSENTEQEMQRVREYFGQVSAKHTELA